LYASVIVDIAHSNIDRCFTYRIPDGMRVQAGHRVAVPFGHSNKPIEGFVLSLQETVEEAYTIKPLLRLMDPYPALLPEQLAMARWMQQTYHCLMIDALRLMLPAAMRGGRVKEKQERTVRLNEGLDIEAVLSGMLDKAGKPKAPKQYAVLAFLRETGLEMSVQDIKQMIPGAAEAISALLKKGYLTEAGHVTFRRPNAPAAVRTERPILNAEQQAAVEAVRQSMEEHAVFLLHGVTGSGKTEVYLNCIETAIQNDKSAIVLVPEIALTPQTVQRFQSRFGETVAVLHSRLSDGERFDEWRRIRLGKARLVVGARSAVFAPVENLGLIVIDEEHETSYQSETIPRYHAVEVAKKRCQLAGVPLLLGSATPSIPSYHRALNGKYRLITLQNWVNRRPLPAIITVDMRQEFATGNTSIFSSELFRRLKACIQSGKQAILFINRRGYSTFVSCRGCGYVFECPDCDVSLTYHKLENRIKCHYCGHEQAIPPACPKCGKPYIKYFGIGTQQVEEQFKRVFPGVSVLRMDMDTTRKKDAHQQLLAAFSRGEAQVLIGTQMVAKGLDFPNVTLVGVMAADATLHFPDYRSEERTFQLITQVAGRAGRDESPGSVVVQTYCPEHPCITFAQQHDYHRFFRYEIRHREAAGFPPFTLFVRALFSGIDPETIHHAAERYRQEVETVILAALGEHRQELLMCQCSPSPVRKKRGVYRHQVVIKLRRTGHTMAALQAIYSYTTANRDTAFATLEVNPGDLL